MNDLVFTMSIVFTLALASFWIVFVRSKAYQDTLTLAVKPEVRRRMDSIMFRRKIVEAKDHVLMFKQFWLPFSIFTLFSLITAWYSLAIQSDSMLTNCFVAAFASAGLLTKGLFMSEPLPRIFARNADMMDEYLKDRQEELDFKINNLKTVIDLHREKGTDLEALAKAISEMDGLVVDRKRVEEQKKASIKYRAGKVVPL